MLPASGCHALGQQTSSQAGSCSRHQFCSREVSVWTLHGAHLRYRKTGLRGTGRGHRCHRCHPVTGQCSKHPIEEDSIETSWADAGRSKQASRQNFFFFFFIFLFFFSAIIWQAKIKWKFSSGCPLSILLVHFSPFGCSNFFPFKLKAQFVGGTTEVLHHFS